MSAIVEPFFTCLIASMIWAPIVFLVASRFHKQDNPALADKLWPAALSIAALPALMAPVAASFGLSLRSEPPLPPMAEAGAPTAYAAPSIMLETPASAPAVDLAAMLQAGAALYMYGLVLFLALGLARLVGFSYRVRYACDLDEPRLETGLETWRRRMGLKRAPRYAITDAVSSVCVHGFFRPVILMPMNLLERVSIDDAILMGAHEMAHVKRGDTWLFAFTKIVKAIFWFNPFMHRISARAHLAAEQAADALVIDRGVDRRQYAKCFVQGLRFAAGLQPREYALVPSFTPFDKRSRRQRLDAILSRTGAAPFLGLPGRIGLVLSIAAAGALALAQAAFAVSPKPPAQALPQVPVEGEITFGYGDRDPKLGPDRPTHEGVDIKAPRGTPVRAAGNGKVIDATSRYRGSKAWGNVVVVDHGHGLVTRYAHLDSFIVRKGDTVKAGDTIGAVGATGVVTGPHLHFEVILDGANIDPTPVVAEAAPAPRPAIKSTRAAVVAPMPRAFAEPSPAAAPDAPAPAEPPEAAEAPEAPEAPLGDRIATRVNGSVSERLNGIGERLDDALGEFDYEFEALAFEFDEMDSEAFADAQVYAMEAIDAVRGWEGLSEEEREEIREAHREAMAEAREAMREAKRDIERAKRDIERVKRDAERQRERARLEAERAKEEAERIERDAERQRERAQIDAERARHEAERIERDIESRRERARIESERVERDSDRVTYSRENAKLDAKIAKLDDERTELHAERARLDGERTKLHTDRARLHGERTKRYSELQAELERERAELRLPSNGEDDSAEINARYANDDEAAAIDRAEKSLSARELALNGARAEIERKLAELERQRSALENRRQ